MAGIWIGRDDAGRWRVRTIGCCGNPEYWKREYERAFVEQELRAGGSVVETGDGTAMLTDHKGRLHEVSATSVARP